MEIIFSSPDRSVRPLYPIRQSASIEDKLFSPIRLVRVVLVVITKLPPMDVTLSNPVRFVRTGLSEISISPQMVLTILNPLISVISIPVIFTNPSNSVQSG